MILELSQAISRQLGTNYVSVEHMLYAVMREQDCLGNRLMPGKWALIFPK